MTGSPARQWPRPLRWLRAAWRRSGARTPGLALFVVIAAGLLGCLALIVTTLQSERDQRAQAARTAGVIGSLNDMLVATVLGETGQRGYLITNDERYLAPWRDGRAQYRAALGRLHGQLGASLPASQRDLVGRIERLGDSKWAEMDDTVALMRQGRVVDAQVRVLSDEGQALMSGLRDAVQQLESIERGKLGAASDRASAAEARITPLLLLLFLAIVVALALGLWQIGRVARAEAAAANADAIAAARDRADLLARELNHRVKNLFAVVLAIVRMTGKGDPAAKPTVDRIAERIHALVTAHDVTQGTAEAPEVDLADLVEKAIAPYRADPAQCALDGEATILPARLAMPIGLVLHELVTNAVKYGAWSQPEGRLAVRWRRAGGRVTIDWRETCTLPGDVPERTGFGSMLMQSSARQLDGTIAREFTSGGLTVRIDFPAD
ncbi:MAG: CHASE3 domain-containing protein [Sphingomonadales bacterium]|nr:CHASE3 domain-containing protein [Sphingomonadales bacterium]MDE2570006.1 CHASE3 domain-containing protein [Sphingomonadales bacterium]